MGNHPAALLNLWDVLDDTIVTTEGCYVRGFRLKGLDSVHQCGADLLAAASRLYDRSKRDLPEDLHLQIVVHGHQDNTDILEPYKANVPKVALLRRQHAKRVQFLEASGSRRLDCYAFVGSTRGLSSRQFAQVSEKTHNKRVASAVALADNVKAVLQAAGIGCEALSTDELWRLIDLGINSDLPSAPPPDLGGREDIPTNPVHIDPLSPRDKLLRSEIRWDDNYVQIGNRYHKVLTLKEVPESTTFTLMEVFGELPVDFRLSVSLRIPEQRSLCRRLQRLRRWSNATAHNPHVSDDQAESKLRGANDLSALLAETGQKLVLIGMQLVLSAAHRDELERVVMAVTKRLSAAGLGWFEETRAHDRELFKTLPGLALRFDRHLVVTSNNAVDLMPVFSPEHGDRNPALMLHTATGNHLFGYNPYERNRDNWNATVFGASGSGKSVIVNMLMTSAMLGQNYGCGRVLVVDHAGPNKSSYKMLAELFDGLYQTVVADAQCALSPFPVASVARNEDGSIRGDVLARLLVMTDLLLENTAEGQESARNRLIIQKAIVDTYAELEGDSRPGYRDVLRVLQGYSQTAEHPWEPARLRAAVELLQGFVSGSFAKHFESPEKSSRDEDKAFVVYDLFGLEALPVPIQNALVYLVSSRVRDLAFDPNDARMKTVILDEVAQLIRQPSMLTLFQELYCTARGHNTSVWTITQLYSEYCKSAVADTVQANSTTAFFLNHAEQAEGVRRRIVEDWHFNGREASLFKSLRCVKGRFSELLVRTEVFDPQVGKRPVTSKLRLLLSALDYEVVTSDRLDRERQQEYIGRHPELPLVDALERLAKEKQRALARQARSVEPAYGAPA